MDWKLFGSTFGLIFVAELPDKTAFACLLLATRLAPFGIFLGAAAAFVIQSLVAVLFGSVIGLLPERFVHTGAGILFLAFAVLMWRKSGEEEPRGQGVQSSSIWKAAGTAFLTIFIAEWGDLTQLATATLVAKYHETLTIFVSATLALWTVTVLGVTVGHFAKSALHPVWLQRIAAAAFTGVGVYFLAHG